MRIITISRDEAADAAVFANIAKYLLHDDPHIAYIDRPDVGAEAAPVPLPTPPMPQAAIVFAGNPLPTSTTPGIPVPPIPGAAPSTAAVAAPVIAATPSTPSASAPSLPAALPASAAGVPTVPAVPPSPAVGGTVEVDAHGFPWDHRIHSKTKTKNKDGTWRQKRETDPGLIQTVEAELRAVMGIAAPPPATAAPTTPTLPAVPPSPLPTLPAVPLPPAAAAPVAPPARTFAGLMEWLEPHMTANRITQDHIKAAQLTHGVPGSLGALIHRPDVVPAVWAELEKLVA